MVKLATQQYKINVNYRYYIQRFCIIMLPLSHCLLLLAVLFNALRPVANFPEYKVHHENAVIRGKEKYGKKSNPIPSPIFSGCNFF